MELAKESAMAPSRAAYRRVPDLYTVGTELELRDGTVMWLQVMNPFERDEATHDATAVRARISLALTAQPESEEMAQVRAMYLQDGRAAAIEALMAPRRTDAFVEVIDEMRSEDEWRERVDLLQRNPDLSTVATDAEREFLMGLQEAYAVEVAMRLKSASDVEQEQLEALDDDALHEEYAKWWIDQRGSSLGMAEYRLTEMWFSCRACAGTRADGGWDHDGCDGHRVRVFESKDEVKHLPEALQVLIAGALAELEMTERDAKN
jgi:hypothetical protein